jgi:hypothetical protein
LIIILIIFLLLILDDGLEEGALLKLGSLESDDDEEGWVETLGNADGELEGLADGSDE